MQCASIPKDSHVRLRDPYRARMNRKIIATLSGSGGEPRVKHYTGMPPSLAEGQDQRIEMKAAAILVIEESEDGVYLYRYAVNSSFAGDTWHVNTDEAMEQVTFEFGEVPIVWKDVPGDIEDPVAFGLAKVQYDAPAR